MLGCGGLFAPTIRHHNGRFYVICTNASTTPAFKVDNFYIWTDDIWNGPWSDPVFFPFRGIDPSLFFEDGRAYVQGSFSLGMDKHPSCTIKQFEMDMETGKPLAEPVEIWAGHSRVDTEGPHIYRKDGYYYLLAAEGGTFEHHMLSIARSKNLWGPYESFGGNPIMTSDGKPGEYIQNIGHGELVEDSTGQWWAVVLGVRKANGSHPLGRESFLTPVEWPAGGWPIVSQPRSTFTAPAVVPCASPSEDARIQELFDKNTTATPRHLEYLHIRDPDPACYRLPAADGEGITLRPSLADLSQPTGTSTFVGKRQRSLDTVAEATLDLASISPGKTEIVTGLTVYKHHIHHISLQYEAKTGVVTFRGVNQVTGLSRVTGVSLAVSEDETRLNFKVQASATEYRGYVCAGSETGQGWTYLGSWNTADFTENEMTGPILGLFATSPRVSDGSNEVVFTKLDV